MIIPTGEPRNNITQIILPSLRSRIRSALYKVRRSQEPIVFHALIPVDGQEETKRTIRVEIALLEGYHFSDEDAIGIIFHDDNLIAEQESLTSDDEVKASQSLEKELAETKEELQNTIEELETSTEELKASHEEALSTNEELQSANEELEASAEELRSLNEELSTLNAQLKDKIEQLQNANDDLENFFASTNLPTIFLDPDLKIQRYTPAAEKLLKMAAGDVGRPIFSLGRDLVDDELTEECKSVLQDFQPIRKEKRDYNGRWYIRQLTPYRTEDRRIEGVVIVFQDVTEIKNLSTRAESREQQQYVVARLGMLALKGAEPEELMHQAVRQVAHTLHVDYCKILKYQPNQKNFLLIAGHGWQEGLVGKVTVPDQQNSQAGYTLIAQEPVIVKNLAEEKRFKGPEILTDHHVVSGISCLINHSDPPYGVLGVHTRTYREFTVDDANFLVSVANMLSTAIRTKEDQQKIFASEEQFRTMANSIPQLAWMTDETGYINWYNQRWYDYTGTTLDDVKGWDWQKVHHPDHVDRVRELFKQNVASGEAWEDTFPLRGKDGLFRWFLSRAQPIRDAQGNIIRWFGTNTDITEQRDRAQALHESEEKLRLAMTTTQIGSFEFSLQKEETPWDPLLRSLWGVPKDEPVTQEFFWKAIHPDDVDMVRTKLTAAVNAENYQEYHATYRVINQQTGQISWIEASGKTIFENNQPVKMVGMVIDMSERKKLEVSLQQAVKELKETDQRKNEFLSILGHELRNPLASLSGGVEILESEMPEVNKIFSIMKHSIGTMARLLDDLLDLNRISQNKIELDIKMVDLKKILEDVIETTESVFKKKNQIITAHLDKAMFIQGDPTRLEQIFSNLLVNASKYTAAGGKVEIQAAQNGDTATINIHDNGIGIEQNIIEEIFTPFFQVTQTGSAPSGLGIGLALSRKLVELHQGSITAQSAGKEKGSTFSVTLPAQQIVPVDINTGSEYQTNLPKGFKIVLIDDSEDIQITFPILLTNLGCNVKIAGTGKEGLSLARKFKPDAMIIDIGLPDITGHDVAAQLRKEGYSNLLIAMSAYSHKESREKSLQVGFNYHLAKPATLREIVNALMMAQKES